MNFYIVKIAAACIPLFLNVTSANAVPMPGGSLDPLTIPKYVTPLVIPPVLYDDQNGIAPINASVALRQFRQQVLPAGFPTTTLWGYGNPDDSSTFHNPAFTFEVTQNTLTTVTWQNELVDATGAFLPHIITDSSGNPLVDQTLMWAAPNQDCIDGLSHPDCRGASAAPYTGPIPMVTSVHGAHVGPISSGYPEAWTLPAANNIPAGYATEGTYYDDINGGAPGTGSAVYQYDNSQPTSTLWYHDNSLGMTRLNVYAAGAGFWLIRDRYDGESGLLSGVLPGPAAVKGQGPNGDPAVRAAIREIPLAIQPRSFNADGSQYYPADRQFFEGLGDGQTYAQNDQMSSLVTADGTFPFLPQSTSDLAPVWNPEAFFNTMVVNGRTWPKLHVAPERYRFRVLNAADSRFLNLSLLAIEAKVRGNGTTNEKVLGELPLYQIGSEQGMLPYVVRIETGFATTLPGDGRDVCTTGGENGKPKTKGQGAGNTNCVNAVPGTFAEQALLIAPGERADVIIDFSMVPEDTTLVRMINTAPDAPFGGFPDVPADADTTGQVMQFVLDPTLATPGGDLSTPAPSLAFDDANPSGAPKLGPSTVTQDLALLEEESNLVCAEVNAVTGAITHVAGDPATGCPLPSAPFAPMAAVLGVDGSAGLAGSTAQLWDNPISTTPALDAIETWELWNHSADAHPIHLHLVKFEVVNREVIGGVVRGPEPWEAGWKDTIIVYPGEVTRIKAQFDISGLYTWHSNILSHRDNEMMVPYCVGTPGINCPAELF